MAESMKCGGWHWNKAGLKLFRAITIARAAQLACVNNSRGWGRLAAHESASRNQDFQQYITHEIEQRYDQPFMAAVAALPRQDLANMAEALVSLTAFLMRMSADQPETVAEPIDVAMLAKGDGFVWIKRKDFLDPVSCPRCRVSGPAR